MTRMTIGELAREAGVNIETVRYYERRGLMPEPARRLSGYRAYTSDSLVRLRFIKSAQELGFSLAEVETLLALRVDASTSCGEVKRQAEAKLAQINAKIQALQQIQHGLTQLVAACEHGGPEGECPLLEALEAQTHNRQARKKVIE